MSRAGATYQARTAPRASRKRKAARRGTARHGGALYVEELGLTEDTDDYEPAGETEIAEVLGSVDEARRLAVVASRR